MHKLLQISGTNRTHRMFCRSLVDCLSRRHMWFHHRTCHLLLLLAKAARCCHVLSDACLSRRSCTACWLAMAGRDRAANEAPAARKAAKRSCSGRCLHQAVRRVCGCTLRSAAREGRC